MSCDNNNDSKFHDLRILKLLRKARFSVYLARLPDETKKVVVLKMFPFVNNKKMSSDYINESSFRFLDHKNVVKMLYC